MKNQRNGLEASCVHRWILIGALPGVLMAVFLVGPELLRSVYLAATGGRGEAASLGEPLFWMTMIAVVYVGPGAGLGCLIGTAIDRFHRHRESGNIPPCDKG